MNAELQKHLEEQRFYIQELKYNLKRKEKIIVELSKKLNLVLKPSFSTAIPPFFYFFLQDVSIHCRFVIKPKHFLFHTMWF